MENKGNETSNADEINNIDDLIKLLEGKNKSKIIIPEYQREYVWDGNGNVSLLLDSIYNNYPIGSVILWNNNDNYYLIDGLQRSFSIFAIKKFPHKFLSVELMESFIRKEKLKTIIKDGDHKYLKSLFNKLANKILNKNESEIKRNLYSKDKISEQTLESFIFYDEPNYEERVKELINRECNNNSLTDYIGVIDKIINWIKPKENVSDCFGKKKLSLIMIENIDGIKDVPKIFERINNNGKKLSKYEIYSSMWTNYPISLKMKNNNIINYVESRKKRYEDSLNVNKIEIIDINESEKFNYNPSIVISSILYKSIEGNQFMKNMFMTNEVFSDMNSMSYIIANYLGIIGTKQFGEIGKKLKDEINENEVNYLKIIKNLKNAFKTVAESLNIFRFLSNEFDDEKINFKKIKISEHLIIAFINTVINIKLKREGFEEVEVKAVANNFKKWFILEGIDTNFGSGTGNKAWKLVNKDKKYIQLDENELNRKLNSDITAYIKEEESKKRMSTFSKQAVLILSLIQNEENESIIRSHVDHVIPKSVLKKSKIKTSDIHSLFNLQLLDGGTNSTKNKQLSIENKQWDWILSSYNENNIDKTIYSEALNSLIIDYKKNGVINEGKYKKYLKERKNIYLKIIKIKIDKMCNIQQDK